MPNQKNYLCFDFETTGVNPLTCEPTQIACVALDSRTLDVIPGSEFKSLMKPLDLREDNVDLLNNIAAAQQKTGISYEMLVDAPEQKEVWNEFVDHIKRYSKTPKSTFQAPIPLGYNIIGYDMKIINRLAKLYGPWDEKKEQNKVFNPMFHMDLMYIVFQWFESFDEEADFHPDNMKLETVGSFVGEDVSGTHDALVDVMITANIFRRFMLKTRQYSQKMRWN